MPRLQPQILRRARRIAPELAKLLPACKSLQSAQNELRWLREHVEATTQPARRHYRLVQLCHQRGRGVPLQYLLGTQPFAGLDIKCRPGTLIPRPETEAYSCHLVDLLKSGALLGHPTRDRKVPLAIIDFCTGTGCIPLYLFASLQNEVDLMTVCGIDISPEALELATANASHNIKGGFMRPPSGGQSLHFSKSDVFSDADMKVLANSRWDIMISNPPYVSRDIWNHGRGQLAYSVRKHEPRLALVPSGNLPAPPPGLQPEDIFYARLLDVASFLRPRVILFEIGDDHQARRALQYCAEHAYSATFRMEVWRDWPDLTPTEDEEVRITVRPTKGTGRVVQVMGSGNMRSILMQNTLDS